MDENLVGRLVRSMADLRVLALETVGDCSGLQRSRPELVIVFGSFARGDTDADSDLDVVIVRPPDIDDSDSVWSESLFTLHQDLARALGNPVNILEIGKDELERRLRSASGLWRSIRDEGVVVYGDAPKNLRTIVK
jgi:predicted nucleotidyltransferase